MNNKIRSNPPKLFAIAGNGFLLLIFLAFASTSCLTGKKIKYFDNLPDSGTVKLPTIVKPEAVIMPDDLLEIKIAGANEATAALLNTYSSTPNNVATVPAGYLVDRNGDIEFPIIGKVKAAGYTKEEFKNALKDKVSKYLKDPLIAVKFLNFRFTVLGEVKAPGTYAVQNERVTILDAMGLAGDMTSYSKRSKVRLIRDSSGTREVTTLDFTDKSLFNSKYYYLQRNDVVYVEAEKSKTQYEEWSRISTIIATITSLIALTITILR